MLGIMLGIIMFGASAVSAQMPHRTPEDVADNARWLVHSASWGYLTELDSAKLPMAGAVSISDGDVGDSTGRLFLYLMGSKEDERLASLSISEAALNTSCGNRDPEDPRCAKIALSGTLKRSSGNNISVGKSALFARHPQMQTWPKDHGFEVHELTLSSIWMIDFYGGGGEVKVSDFLAAKAKHNVPAWPPAWKDDKHHNRSHWHRNRSHWHHDGSDWHHNWSHWHNKGSDRHRNRLQWHGHQHGPMTGASKSSQVNLVEPPPWNQTAARARWLVYHSVWGSVGTISVHLEGAPWGSMRSVADGVGRNSTGTPVLYIPSPDPLAFDIGKTNNVTLSFSEAALPQRFSSKGTCNGVDTEDPTCAQITLSGRLRALSETPEIKQAEVNLGQRHPLAPWLAHGGDHTGGKYYIMDIKSIMFLDFYGGPARLSVAEYLAAPPPQYQENEEVVLV